MIKSKHSRRMFMRLFYLVTLILITIPVLSSHVLASNLSDSGQATETLEQDSSVDFNSYSRYLIHADNHWDSIWLHSPRFLRYTTVSRSHSYSCFRRYVVSQYFQMGQFTA